jgi:DNA-binding MarR family transcriptional regulator
VFFERWELSPSQFNVLNLLHSEPGGLSQVELSRQLLMHRSNVTGLVDRLEQRGLVRRQEVPGDRRAYSVGLTPAGAALLNKILPHYYQAADFVWEHFPAKRIGELTADLRRLAENAEQAASRVRQSVSSDDLHGKETISTGTRGRPKPLHVGSSTSTIISRRENLNARGENVAH